MFSGYIPREAHRHSKVGSNYVVPLGSEISRVQVLGRGVWSFVFFLLHFGCASFFFFSFNGSFLLMVFAVRVQYDVVGGGGGCWGSRLESGVDGLFWSAEFDGSCDFFVKGAAEGCSTTVVLVLHI